MRFLILAAFVLFSPVLWAQSAADRAANYNLGKTNLAIKGYDPVAYFTRHIAVEGKKEWAVSYESVLYYFSSAENKELFKKNPAAYEPQYGGWCAYAMGNSGEKVDIDPGTFKIKEGKLYLFYNKYFNNTLKSWDKDELNLQRKADQNWLKLLSH